LVSPNTKVSYLSGENIDDAVALARQATVVILALGEKKGISGEGFDRSDLDLPGNQEALLEAVAKTGVPVVLVLQNGRALTIPGRRNMSQPYWRPGIPVNLAAGPLPRPCWATTIPPGGCPFRFPNALASSRCTTIIFRPRETIMWMGMPHPSLSLAQGLSYTTFQYDHLRVTPPAPGDRRGAGGL
jgi:beta-glucosidase